MEGTIRINGKQYPYSFKHKSRRVFMEKHGLVYWDDFAKELEHLDPHPEKGMSMKGLEVFSSLVISGIVAESPGFDDFDADDLIDFMIQDPGMLESLMKTFMASMEQLRPAQKPKQKGTRSNKKSVSSGKKSKGAG